MTIEKADKGRKYSLHALILDKNPDIPLDEREFLNLKKAKECLTHALVLEEAFDLLLGNYRDLELETLSSAVMHMTSSRHDYEDFFEIRTSINRRLVNLLTSTRMYLDQHPQRLKRIGADPADAKLVCSKAYDDFFEYRFMEALRNHAQHAGLAVHGVTLSSSWLPPGERAHLQFSTIPYASKKVLEEDKTFKKKVLYECPEKVPLLFAARTYVGCISTIHKKVRELIEPFVSAARSLFEDAISRHSAEAGESCSGLAAIAKEDGRINEEISIFLDWDDVRQKLEKQNRPLIALGHSYVSSQEKKKDDT